MPVTFNYKAYLASSLTAKPNVGIQYSNFVITESADDMQRTLEITNLNCHVMPITKQSTFTVNFINMLHVHVNESSIGTL